MGYRTGGLSENEVTLPSSEKVVIYMWGKFTLKAENCIKYPCAYMVKKINQNPHILYPGILCDPRKCVLNHKCINNHFYNIIINSI